MRYDEAVSPLLPIALAVVGPGSADAEALAQQLTQALEAQACTTVTRLAGPQVTACRGSFACFVQLARPDYDRQKIGHRTYTQYLDEVRDAREPVARVLIVLSTLPSGDRTQVALAILDTDAALTIAHDAPRTPDAQAQVDAALDAQALALDRTPSVVAGAPDRDAFVARTLAAVEPTLTALDAWGPPATLVLTADVEGYVLRADTRVLGELTRGSNVRRDLGPGRHRLELLSAGRVRWSQDIVLERGVTLAVAVDHAALTPGTSPVHTATLYGGLVLAAGGAAIGVAALALASAATPQQVCVGPPELLDRCPPPVRVGFGFDPAAPADGGGPPLAAFALGLLGAGATASIGAGLSDEAEIPWLALTASLVAGVAGVVVGATY